MHSEDIKSKGFEKCPKADYQRQCGSTEKGRPEVEL